MILPCSGMQLLDLLGESLCTRLSGRSGSAQPGQVGTVATARHRQGIAQRHPHGQSENNEHNGRQVHAGTLSGTTDILGRRDLPPVA